MLPPKGTSRSLDVLVPAIDLTRVFWEAKHTDGTILRKGEGQYEKIDRTRLESIDVIFEGKQMLRFGTKGRTFFWRLRSAQPMEISYANQTITQLPVKRLGIMLGLIKKNKIPDLNRRVRIYKILKDGSQVLDQQYYYDPELSTFYIIFENGKIEIRNTFSNKPPLDKVKLRPEELAQLNG